MNRANIATAGALAVSVVGAAAFAMAWAPGSRGATAAPAQGSRASPEKDPAGDGEATATDAAAPQKAAATPAKPDRPKQDSGKAVPATPAAGPAIPPGTPGVPPQRVAVGCADAPFQDGCYSGNAMRVGQFVCKGGDTPIAVEFLNSPVRAKFGIIGRTAIAPSTAVMLVNQAAPAPVDLSTAANLATVDVVTVKDTGEIAVVAVSRPPSGDVLHIDPVRAVMLMGSGETKRLGIDKTCGFALAAAGMPPIGSKKALDTGLNLQR